MKHVAVIGASLAGLSAARALRSQGFQGRLTIVGAENHRPYDRPPLSKELLAGTMTVDELALERDDEDLRADWRLGVRADRLELAAGVLHLDDGSSLQADGIVIATGAAARRFPGTEGVTGVHVLRTLDDALDLRAELVAGTRLVVVGAGFIGAEVASTAHSLGVDVTVLEVAPTPLSGPLGVQMGGLVAGLHADHGVRLHCGVEVSGVKVSGVEASGGKVSGGKVSGVEVSGGKVSGIAGTARVTAVALADGRQIPADVVVIGVGAVPNVGWLQNSGLDIGNGVHCDEVGGTGHPNVVAVGDCSAWLNPRTGRHQRVEHWTAARDRPSVAVATLLSQAAGAGSGPAGSGPAGSGSAGSGSAASSGSAGRVSARERAPYFWSDQYGIRIQFAGQIQPGDEVVLEIGAPQDKSFLAVYRRDGAPVAVLGVDQVREFTRWRRQIA